MQEKLTWKTGRRRLSLEGKQKDRIDLKYNERKEKDKEEKCQGIAPASKKKRQRGG